MRMVGFLVAQKASLNPGGGWSAGPCHLFERRRILSDGGGGVPQTP